MPATDAAMLVVSESGDILSPKNAPDTTAPAVIARLAPKASPMPIKATPMVAQVVRLLPMAMPISEHKIKADK